MSNTIKQPDDQSKKHEIKHLTLEDLKRVRGGGGETELDDYNYSKCTKKCETFEEQIL